MNSQSLTFVLYSNPQLKDPFDAATAERFLVYRQLVRSLTSIDAQGALSGDLAKSWKASGDHRVFTFELNDGKWSDGMRVLASDFVRTFIEGKKAPFSVHFDHSKVKKVSAPNDYTFEIEFTKPHPNALYQLSLPEAGLLYRRDFEHTDPRLFRITPGAYSF